jgi:hypothetical protein
MSYANRKVQIKFACLAMSWNDLQCHEMMHNVMRCDVM